MASFQPKHSANYMDVNLRKQALPMRTPVVCITDCSMPTRLAFLSSLMAIASRDISWRVTKKTQATMVHPIAT